MVVVKNRKIKLVYFSPTGTSKRAAEAVAKGLGAEFERVDLTSPVAETEKHSFKSDVLAVIAVPVYSGRVPYTAVRRLKNVKGRQGPAVIMVVYGNRAYEDALIELKDIAHEQGFQPIAGAAFIGEHSFDTPETPIAKGRPDEADLDKAEAFGEQIKAKLGLGEAPELVVPGHRPYRENGDWNKPYEEREKAEPLSPETDPETCTLCGRCAQVCPTAAVTVTDSVKTVKTECIACTACVKCCPAGARTWTHERVKNAAFRLHTNCSERREPELFL
jgi:flavodoxin/NAD-dependent dihydropyrimidine dehydrogenase PreA subunit